MKDFDLRSHVDEHNQFLYMKALGCAALSLLAWWLCYWLAYGFAWTFLFFEKTDATKADESGGASAVFAWVVLALLAGEGVRYFLARAKREEAGRMLYTRGPEAADDQEAERFLEGDEFKSETDKLGVALMIALAAPRLLVEAYFAWKLKMPEDPDSWEKTKILFNKLGRQQGWSKMKPGIKRGVHLYRLHKLGLLQTHVVEGEGEVRLPSPIIAEYFSL